MHARIFNRGVSHIHSSLNYINNWWYCYCTACSQRGVVQRSLFEMPRFPQTEHLERFVLCYCARTQETRACNAPHLSISFSNYSSFIVFFCFPPQLWKAVDSMRGGSYSTAVHTRYCQPSLEKTQKLGLKSKCDCCWRLNWWKASYPSSNHPPPQPVPPRWQTV